MSLDIWARPLTQDEETFFREGKLGNEVADFGPLAIMGREDHINVKYLCVESKLYRVDLGEVQYIMDSLGLRQAGGGRKVPIHWSLDSALSYLERAAKELRIPIFSTQVGIGELIYFEKKYINQFVDGFSCADKSIEKWYNSRSLLSRWFDEPYPTGEASSNIHLKVISVLSGASKE